MSRSAFERYAPYIREYIYKKKWHDLREVQIEACEAILDSEENLIVASATASGKTEAVFFPILTQLYYEPSDTIGVIYIGPLKALINDQFERLDELLEDSHITVWPWHGDISQTLKNKVLRNPTGVLQITPESLEAMIMRRPGEVARLFADLRFVVIDEIHSLIGSDRGLQVANLISRLSRIAKCKPRIIALSATLSDYETAISFISCINKQKTTVIGMNHHARTISLSAEIFSLTGKMDEDAAARKNYFDYIYQTCHNSKALIFTNSRSGAEETIAELKKIARNYNDKDVFYVHHGSVSSALRHDAEFALRESNEPAVAAATLTLELGIDIGDLDLTIQTGAPFSCASFVQRLGRSGRRSGKSKMMFVDLVKNSGGNSFERLPWNLLRAIAIIQLYLEEQWVEPFTLKPKPFSFLAHQTLSTLISTNGLKPNELARQVLTLPAFSGLVKLEEYRQLLVFLRDNDYLEQMEEGELIVGLRGEKLTSHYSFYATFRDDSGYVVFSKDLEIGSLDSRPSEGEIFVLAGKSWKTELVDDDKKRVYVSPVKGTKIPIWSGSGGDIHSRIVKRMRQILVENQEYAYLKNNAIEAINEARLIARQSGMLDSDFVLLDKKIIYCPWVGTKEIRTINTLLNGVFQDELEIMSTDLNKLFIEITSTSSLSELVHCVSSLTLKTSDPDVIIGPDIKPIIDKYDYMLPEQLLKQAFVENQLDINEALRILHNSVHNQKFER